MPQVWTIEYYSPEVMGDILELPSSLAARFLQLTDRMLVYGPDLGMPHTRHMGKGLVELRMKGADGIARAFFCTMVGRRIVILHVFVKKSQKTPRRELDIARRRLKELVSR